MSKTFATTHSIIILHFKLEPILRIEKVISSCIEEEQRPSLDGVRWFQTEGRNIEIREDG